MAALGGLWLFGSSSPLMREVPPAHRILIARALEFRIRVILERARKVARKRAHPDTLLLSDITAVHQVSSLQEITKINSGEPALINLQAVSDDQVQALTLSPCVRVKWMAVNGNQVDESPEDFLHPQQVVPLTSFSPKDLLVWGENEEFSFVSRNQLATSSSENSVPDEFAFLLPRLRHIVSQEHRAFLQDIRLCVRAEILSAPTQIALSRNFFKCLQVIRTAAGINQILPYLVFMFSAELKQSVEAERFRATEIFLLALEALILNPNVSLHFYIHQIINLLLEVVECSKPMSNGALLRKFLSTRKSVCDVLGLMVWSLGIANDPVYSEVVGYILNRLRLILINPASSLFSAIAALHGLNALRLRSSMRVLAPLAEDLLSAVSANLSIVESQISSAEESKTLFSPARVRRYLLIEFSTLLVGTLSKALAVEGLRFSCVSESPVPQWSEGGLLLGAKGVSELVEGMGDSVLPWVTGMLYRRHNKNFEKVAENEVNSSYIERVINGSSPFFCMEGMLPVNISILFCVV